MLNINDIAHYIEEKANELSSSKKYNLLFRAKTYASFLDSVVDDEIIDKEFIPIYIDNASGSFQPIPALGEITQSCDISFFFNIEHKIKFMQFLNDFASSFAGASITIANTNCISNASAPIYSQVEQLNFEKFNEFMSYYFQKEVDRHTEFYVIARISMYFTNVAQNNFFFSNGIKFKLAFDYDDEHYEDYLVYYQSSNGLSNNPLSQQLIGDDYAVSINNISNYAKSISCYVKNNEFWKKFIALYNSRAINNIKNVKLVKEYEFLDEELEVEQVLLSINENINIGDLLTYTFSFIDKGSI